MSFEKFGEFLGKTVGKISKEILLRKIENFNTEIGGVENLESLKDQAYLIVANHVKPQETNAQDSGISPDAFIISNLVKEFNNQELKIIQKSDDGWWSENEGKRNFQKNISQPFGEGFTKGLGNIPIKKNPGSLNREFTSLVEKSIEDGNPLLIFPEGNWYKDFNPDENDRDIKPGAAHLAKKFNLPILPVYIKGADSWNKDKISKIRVSFGQSFMPSEELEDMEGERTKDQKEKISERIKKEILALKNGDNID